MRFRYLLTPIAVYAALSLQGDAMAQKVPDGLEFLEDQRVWVIEDSNQTTEIIDGDTLW